MNHAIDVMFVGPATRDVNVDYTGEVVKAVGGAVYFGAYAAKAAGAETYVSVKINPEDDDIPASFRLDSEHLSVLSSKETTLMQNTYFTADRERRNSECRAQSDPILPDEIPDVPCRLYHLAGLLRGDFPDELIRSLTKKGKVSADIQSFLRCNENGKLVFHDWEKKKEFLSCFDFLKTDTAEAEILTGTTDRREAARIMYEWGAKEILISNNAEMLVYDGSSFYTEPVRSRNLSGRTGRGDTVFSAYIARRILGDSAPDALLFATAAVSLKMETPGPLLADEKDIRNYLKEFYLDSPV